MTGPLSFNLQEMKADSFQWEPFHQGIQIHWFYNEGDQGMSAALLKYAPGAFVPRHEHVAFEHILVLEGAQEDENGVHETGNFTVNPPGTFHSVSSPNGCIVLAIWQRPVAFCE